MLPVLYRLLKEVTLRRCRVLIVLVVLHQALLATTHFLSRQLAALHLLAGHLQSFDVRW